MEIRKATMKDLDAVTAVEAECFPAAEAATRADFEKRLAMYPDHFWLLMENEEGISDSGEPERLEKEAQSGYAKADMRYGAGVNVTEEQIIGFVNGMVTDEPNLADEMYENAALHKEDGKWQMIFGVNTLPQYRRQGYAELILRQVIAEARSQGREGLVLTCKEKLLHYYAKLGFEDEGVSQSVHGNATWYQMRLRF